MESFRSAFNFPSTKPRSSASATAVGKPLEVSRSASWAPTGTPPPTAALKTSSTLPASTSTVAATPAGTAPLASPQSDPSSPYLPISIWATVGYSSERELTPARAAAVQHIKASYVIPADLETNVTYGPLAGSCFSDRIIAAHAHGKLALRAGSAAVQVCVSCGKVGHPAARCPSAF